LQIPLKEEGIEGEREGDFTDKLSCFNSIGRRERIEFPLNSLFFTMPDVDISVLLSVSGIF